MTSLYTHIKELLAQNEKYCKDGKLFKNVIIEAALQLDPALLKLILSDEKARGHFFQEVEGFQVFDKVKFQHFVSNKQFLPDSFTAYKNKIGLTAGGTYLTESKEVVLDFPYKDCVLEGGQTKEDQKRQEIFWNETLAPDEIDRLLDPKLLTNWKRYDQEGVQGATSVSLDDNLVIKGNNLLALHSLVKVYRGKVKLIYIDPPYNTGKDDFGYNDRFNHSAWLTFVKNRLEIAKQLLHPEGSIWINIDDNEAHYLKVLADTVLGRSMFKHNVVWEKKYTVANDASCLSDNHDHILFYAYDSMKINKLPRTKEMDAAYTNPDNHPKGRWKATPLQARSGTDSTFSHTFPNGVSWSPPEGRFSAYSHEKLDELYNNGEIYFGRDGTAIPSRKSFLSELKSDGLIPRTLWRHNDVGHNHESMKEIKALFSSNIFTTPKPERLIKQIIHIGSKEGDLVLDFFAGSGTTAAVAHKMGRRYITCEQMDYVHDVTIARLQKVLEGEQGGISKSVEWQGGGSFVYTELAESNAAFVDAIQEATTTEQLLELWQSMKATGFLNYKVDPSAIDDTISDFEELSLEDQKRLLISTLDKNQLYINYSERHNKDYNVPEEDIHLSDQFYNLK